MINHIHLLARGWKSQRAAKRRHFWIGDIDHLETAVLIKKVERVVIDLPNVGFNHSTVSCLVGGAADRGVL